MKKYNEIEGRLKVTLTEDSIKEILPSVNEGIEDCIIRLNKWALPNWEEVKYVRTGAVQISSKTAEMIIGRLKLVTNIPRSELMLIWLNYGWSVNEELEKGECSINFYKVEYKEN
jgi:hypothetical protein